MVLDGAMDPSFDLLAFAREQALAVEAAPPPMTRRPRCRAGTESLCSSRSPRASGAPAAPEQWPRAARSSDVLYGSVEALVEPDDGWPELALALGAAQAGDGSGFVALADRYFQRRSDGSSGLRVETQLAVLCADLRRLESAQAYRDAAPELARESPHIGVPNLLAHLPCAFWPLPARAFEPPHADDAANVLVIAGRADPLTPHVWGERMAAELRGSTLLSVDTQGTAFDSGLADRCARDPLSGDVKPLSSGRQSAGAAERSRLGQRGGELCHGHADRRAAGMAEQPEPHHALLTHHQVDRRPKPRKKFASPSRCDPC
jgi:hypothetical protein